MTETKKIYAAMAKVLSAMAVDKNGELPSNMGGRPYITAVDLAAEAKRQFVTNGIIVVPNESVTKHEVLESGNRKMIVIGIEGVYDLIAVEDGSSVTISGVGDGTALGTSVASNIASTNAMKNALLRTFLITEQSAEDQAKQGDGEEKAAPAAVQAAKKQTAAKKPDAAKKPTSREAITEWIGDDEDRRNEANGRINYLKGLKLNAKQAQDKFAEWIASGPEGEFEEWYKENR